MAKTKLLEDIKADPERFYHSPNDVVRDRRFSDPERLAILEAWERAASDEEGTSANGEPSRLKTVMKARMEIQERVAGDASKVGGGQ